MHSESIVGDYSAWFEHATKDRSWITATTTEEKIETKLGRERSLFVKRV